MAMHQNVPGWERIVRVLVGLAVAVVGGFWALNANGLGWVVVAMGIGFGATGLVGWCPLCAMVGRTLPKVDRTIPVARL